MRSSFALRATVTFFAWSLLLLPVNAASESDLDDLVDAIGLPELMEILRIEGMSKSEELRQSMFPNRAGGWGTIASSIYETDRMLTTFREAFDAELTNEDVAPVLGFLRSDLGTRIIELEVGARRALLDPLAEQAAKDSLDSLTEVNPERVAIVLEFVEVNDLLELNVAGGLNASLAFYKGLVAGGLELTESEMLEQVWAQEPDIRDEIEEWMSAYLIMAYEPLTDEEIREYIILSTTDVGKDLNRALFVGFDALFDQLSFALGLAASQYSASEDI
ncbi:MAG: DUF2059 domain-containing protein [Boseongicola sp.]|nr:MAG: DUF2059 domain-containing protein [Boseongicola sp.]